MELKSWFDPRESQGIAKIVRATFALRNQNGGFLVIGVEDKTLSPMAPPGDLSSVRELFHPDAVQQIISRYASQAFEVAVDFEAVGAHSYPVLSIPSGIIAPVACRADLKHCGQTLLREGDIYVRTLDANGRISSARMSWRDLPDLIGRCFDNREADHVRFVSKLLPSLASDLSSLFEQIVQRPARSTDIDRQEKILERGIGRFDEVARERKIEVRSFGFWDVALRITPETTGYAANQKFLETLRNANPDLTGWPVWLDSSTFHDQSTYPYVYDDAWEAFIYAPRKEGSFGHWGHLDFWIFVPSGQFFLRRVLQDDLGGSSSATTGKTLDPVIAVLRTAEAIAVGQQFARALNCPEESTELVFTFRWSGLKGRHLEAWSTPTRWFDPGGSAKQDSAESTIHFPLAGTRELIVTRTHEGILPLMRVFGGYEIKEPIVRELVDKLLDRKL